MSEFKGYDPPPEMYCTFGVAVNVTHHYKIDDKIVGVRGWGIAPGIGDTLKMDGKEYEVTSVAREGQGWECALEW